MENIIIFKTDRVGDLIHLSGCIKSIHENFAESKITLVCSKYNYQIAKNYSFIKNFIVIDRENSIHILIKYFKQLIINKYNHLFLLDAKNKSLFLSYLIKSKTKSAICFWKVKKIFGFNFNIYRPGKFMLKIFFNLGKRLVQFTKAKILDSTIIFLRVHIKKILTMFLN